MAGIYRLKTAQYVV